MLGNDRRAAIPIRNGEGRSPAGEEVAEEWYLKLRGMVRSGDLEKVTARKKEMTFKAAAEKFLEDFPVLTEGQRNPVYIAGHERPARKYLIPFFGKKGLSEITGGLVNEYRMHRIAQAKERRGKPPARTTMHQEIVCLRQILKTALRHQWLHALPELSEPLSEEWQDFASGLVLARRVSPALPGDWAKGPEAQEQQIQMVGRATARAHPVHEQHRPAAGRGL
ncbi:hypothetical protein [Bradyrhizobium sp. WSM1743]|uniref:hypothetical protein n=1 Tax=Bradyrhizobium sp. WSM1743 TaxID=318996 RepID=UPI00068476B4|nr:hypothetical protein [Bradyrhizobium sp. WSM1743]